MSDGIFQDSPADPHLEHLLAVIRAAAERHIQAVRAAVAAYVQAVRLHQQPAVPSGVCSAAAAPAGRAADPYLEQKLAAIRALAGQRAQAPQLATAGAYLAGAAPQPQPISAAYFAAPSATGAYLAGPPPGADPYLEQKLAAIRILAGQRAQPAAPSAPAGVPEPATRLEPFQGLLAGVQQSLTDKIATMPPQAAPGGTPTGEGPVAAQRLEQIRDALARVQAQLADKVRQEQAAAGDAPDQPAPPEETTAPDAPEQTPAAAPESEAPAATEQPGPSPETPPQE